MKLKNIKLSRGSVYCQFSRSGSYQFCSKRADSDSDYGAIYMPAAQTYGRDNI